MTSPWRWIPTLYIAEGLPYFAVNTLTVLMFTRLEMPLRDMALFTGWLYLPWVVKPFWSPFIDLFKTKRIWTLTMELLIAGTMAAVALFLPGPLCFKGSLVAFWLMAFFSATHDIAADGYYMLELTPHDQAAYVGVRSTFYRIASVLGQGGLVMLAGFLENFTGDIPKAWSLVFLFLSAFFVLVFLYHLNVLPRPESDRPVPGVTLHTIARDFARTFVTFFQKPYVGRALLFMLLYRLPEALCIKIIQPFLLTSRDEGGLGLSTSEIGFVNGTVGVIALLLGGIAGGVAISKGGLGKWLWPMALSLTLPCGLYCWLAMTLPSSLLWINIAVFTEQFGYGFGFSAYMLFLIYFSRGESQTSHYAFCTAFMALGMMLPGMAAGWIFEEVSSFDVFLTDNHPGFVNFFWFVMATCLATLAACASVRFNPDFGKKQ